jgi:predicted amidohydrolase
VTRTRSLAAAQTIPHRGDVDANLAAHVRLVHAAREEGARVLVFPELSLTGYELDLAADLAFTESDPRLDPLRALASSQRMTLVVGAPVRVGARLHVGAFLLFPDGSVGLYTKQHLGAFSPELGRDRRVSPDGVVPPAEATVFQAGDRNPLVHLDGHAAAVAVCADVSRPAHPQAAADRGARTYLASVFVTPLELEHEAARIQAYAARHSMAVVMANYGGPSGGLASAGGSAIWSEEGVLLARLEGTGSGFAVAVEGETGWRAKAVLLEPGRAQRT